jgi:tRNA(fMet)-specific endonuclease VapC
LSPSRELLILDTNVLLHVIRGNEVAERIDGQFNLRHRQDRPLISVVTIGEGLALAKQFGWGEAKCRALDDLFREMVVVDISSRSVLEKFAEFRDLTRKAGRTLSHNDLWIAATAAATGAHLVTTDHDFDVLHPSLIRRTLIEERRDSE